VLPLVVLVAEVSEYKLTDLLGSAGATVGVMIFGTIFLQFLSTKYVQLAGRYRQLTTEYRNGGAGESRHTILQSEIGLYRRRLRLINWGSWLAALALLCFLLAVLVGGLSMIFPPVVWLKAIGTIVLFPGLGLIGAAVLLELVESILGRRELSHAVEDLDDPARRSGS
jgi:hypothetical protein